ncbi:hypothetical protein MBLNU13_g06842t1 [Cladosporium sp. NU13]
MAPGQIQRDSTFLSATWSRCPFNSLFIDRSSPIVSPSTARKGRLIIVSNRLPVSINGLSHDRFELKASSGGLVTGLIGLSNSGIDFLWFGWPGFEIAKKNASFLKTKLLGEHNAIPVMLDQQTSDLYYNGFSNSTIWPLFHYQLDKVSFDDNTMLAYRKVNTIFADTIMPHLEDGDHIWVQDYHLIWFLHIPFPSHDFLDVLPSGRDILDSILGADLVGFQTDQARHNFLTACSQALKWWSTDNGILCGDREVSVQTFPIGIEPSEFHYCLEKSSVQDTLRKMRADLCNTKVILGVDRLDCIRGIPQKLHAFDKLLEQYPGLVGQAVLLRVAIPSRDDLKSHQDLKEEIQHLVGKINGKHGKVNYVPVQSLHTSINPDELTVLYATADVCFLASTRDGMNLVCCKYVACHSNKAIVSSREVMPPGSLVLSKFTGAASLLEGALIVNPWNRESCANALAHALSNPADAAARMSALAGTVEQQTR